MKLRLDEDIFEDAPDVVLKDVEIAPDPVGDQNSGVASLLMSEISSSWEKVDTLNATLLSTDNEQVKEILKGVVNKELEIVGSLQSALKVLSPNTEIVSDSEESTDELQSIE